MTGYTRTEPNFVSSLVSKKCHATPRHLTSPKKCLENIACNIIECQSILNIEIVYFSMRCVDNNILYVITIQHYNYGAL